MPPGPPSSTANKKRFRRPAPKVPKAALAPGLKVSRIIKGCWQLDGQHKGEPSSDRTSGAAALEDFDTFAAAGGGRAPALPRHLAARAAGPSCPARPPPGQPWPGRRPPPSARPPPPAPSAGITSLDTADIYGPAEALAGRYLRLYPQRAADAQLLTKLSFFGDEAKHVSGDLVRYKVRGCMQRLGAQRLGLVQLYWDDFRRKGYVDAALHLAELQAQGLVQHVGLANFDVPHMLQVGWGRRGWGGGCRGCSGGAGGGGRPGWWAALCAGPATAPSAQRWPGTARAAPLGTHLPGAR
jgi:hypothetical protein